MESSATSDMGWQDPAAAGEKALPDHHQALRGLPDPDQGKTDAEKKIIVRGIFSPAICIKTATDTTQDKKLMRKVDFCLVPWLSLLYCLSFIARTNIGNARLQGMEDSLGMDGIDYNMALTIFFVAYAFCDPVVNAILKRTSPRIFFTAIMVISGIIVTLTGLCQNYGGLLAARLFLGIVQSGFFPGANFYMSCWYTSHEIGLRSAIFFSAAALAGSFSGLLAAAIAAMDGVAGLNGWSWIFILEGIVMAVLGVFSWWMVFDWPETARFLEADDRVRLQRRLILDKQGPTAEGYDKRYIYEAIKDWKTYGYMFIYMGCLMPLYAFSLFLPTIIYGMGHHGTMAQLLSVPPYACAALATVVVGFTADHTRWRGYCNMASASIAIAGFIILLSTSNSQAQYAGVFLGAMGIYPVVPNSLSWVSNNTEGSLKRAIALGMVIGWGTLNGAVSSNIYMRAQSPRYWTGHAVVLAYLVLFLLGGSVVMHVALLRENRKRKTGQRDNMLAGLTDDEVLVKGDKRPDFHYTL
ncbi:hypothetical protein S7711_08132 [Stachybotrys chartarum IBT 7711]|uniref:Major facilitator superfamily (MFS) profile domain-containing protein n=1 Tax=Stachybotrys chartarum (strain CBS 109288 / IBT 7711) TaxID=1280523 RepID=A0A084AVP7_STACB|nr:hypothetical protein S7711_08132 [Stachybotrys chartarum IBT 7711]KFA81093.1 hypothetical protein S40288_00989 [Stachybotrys chartarum IBT 40288]